MKKLEVSEQFVKEAHKLACKDLKKRIEEEFPSLFDVKLDVGKWYKNLNWAGSYMLYGGESDTYCHKCIGITFDGEWKDDGYWDVKEKYRLATPTEIESMLWKEAEKRGIGKDTKLDECLVNGNTIWINDGAYDILYRAEDDTLWNTSGCIYNQGKFATPLDPNKEIKETISRLEKELEELKDKVK